MVASVAALAAADPETPVALLLTSDEEIGSKGAGAAAAAVAEQHIGAVIVPEATGNQVVLGTFTSTFLYCLLVLRLVRGSDNAFEADRFIPQVSMLVAVALAVCSLGVLIYFIHHVASSIQTCNVVAAVGRDLLAGIRDLYPEQIGDAPARGEGDGGLAAQVPPRFDPEAVPVRAAAGRLAAVALLA